METWRKILIAIVSLVTIILFVIGLVYILSPKDYIVHVENVFTDIDGDGDTDLLVTGDVIYNNEVVINPDAPVNFP